MPGATSAGRDVAQRLTDDGYVIVSGLMTDADVPAPRRTWAGCWKRCRPAATRSRG